MKLNIDSDVEDEDYATAKKLVKANRRHFNDNSCVKQMFHCLVANHSYRQKRKQQALAKGSIMNSVSKIDSISRVLFPVTFVIINSFYWWGYVAKNNDFTWKNLDKYKFY